MHPIRLVALATVTALALAACDYPTLPAPPDAAPLANTNGDAAASGTNDGNDAGAAAPTIASPPSSHPR